LGGWEHPRGELRGHFAGGHVLSACALLQAATGDDAIKQKGNVLVAELAKCQEKLNQGGYLGAYPTSFYERLKEGKRVWAPFYTYHKILAGHLDKNLVIGVKRRPNTLPFLQALVETGRIHLSQDSCRALGHVHALRKRAGAVHRRKNGRVGRQLFETGRRRAMGQDANGRVRRYGGGSVQPVRHHRKRTTPRACAAL